jgi:hypothetical protein
MDGRSFSCIPQKRKSYEIFQQSYYHFCLINNHAMMSYEGME